MKLGSSVSLFHVNIYLFSTAFMEKTILSLLNYLGTFVQNELTIYVNLNSAFAFLFPPFMSLFMLECTVLIPVALWYVLKLGSVILRNL